jgi:hypothetical protein
MDSDSQVQKIWSWLRIYEATLCDLPEGCSPVLHVAPWTLDSVGWAQLNAMQEQEIAEFGLASSDVSRRRCVECSDSDWLPSGTTDCPVCGVELPKLRRRANG